jgi:predicted DNA-binding transcriptional regulator AlpA
MNDKEPTVYLTKLELASMLRVSTRTIGNYIRSGALPEPVKIGRRALWSRATLLAFLRAQQPQA